jgi:DNA-binding response OmpR family regulator
VSTRSVNLQQSCNPTASEPLRARGCGSENGCETLAWGPSELTKRILIVEDDDAIRHLLSDALQDAGFAVATAIDGFDALDRIDQHPPDAILLDLMMPSMDGWSFIETCRSNRHSAEIPIGILSATPQLHKTANSWGIQVAVSKPFAIDELVSQVEALVEPIPLL